MTPLAHAVAWPAPAKLNLMLRVLGRREDGYHRLQTVFQFIDRCDRLWFAPRTDGAIRRALEIPGVPASADLTVRAAQALRAATGCRLGVDIRLEKVLPMGGGLGGGSSDAATTLVALNRLWGLDLGEDELAGIALPLGADVPVFVRARAAWAEGVGEELTPVELPQPWYLVLIPPGQVSTAAVFADPQLTRDSLPITLADFLRGDRRNDCLDAVRRGYPEVAGALAWLDEVGGGQLTGTGGCVFASFTDQEAALAACERAPERFRAFIARGRNRSPLLDRLTSEVASAVERSA
ncbi:MAG: 4-(cytidine 5'-diphospho)-2-C-methyl-D-erythritol kinase [Lamprocystis purpurea]|jgi:4-diphosphocytidyl-2-C-methyl-D-erythritol kinase|uniref:4-(cytidine 5'-diphospho)-2-C-methyl-D-erythritol kinase n=1 Tax=Lamprocystis purpurea TaxID=61598 RepID=UPI0003787666|nr:4-(cytidine 5'-diphospho)-2-C-methyl-D-erythritol kinase [Lamprocystis purpurea]MBV5275634.1 4-(cytidine 5'-diphospho)-2-C-methyl-D-erythritol kinase [Lamprocystis purpurea]